jgi:hypothetical protein
MRQRPVGLGGIVAAVGERKSDRLLTSLPSLLGR